MMRRWLAGFLLTAALLTSLPAFAVNYITSVGSQQVTITIAVSTTSNTASITTVGTGAFIIFQGCTAQDTGNLNDTFGRVELTNTTTVTAYRGQSNASKTVTCNAVVVDGDTTNLIKSVQQGTVALTNLQTTNTATISAVTNTNTACAFLGETVNATSTSLSGGGETIISLSGTTVTATKQFSGTADTVGFECIEFQGAALNSSTQNVAYAASDTGTSATKTITSVTAGNTWLAYGGQYGNSASNEATTFMYGQLTNGTTITITWNTAATLARAYNAVTVEFVAGVLNQNVQRGTIALSAAASNTATITSSAASSTFCNWLHNSSTATTLNLETSSYKITQTDATTVTETADTAASGTGAYECVQFTPFSSGVVTNHLLPMMGSGI